MKLIITIITILFTSITHAQKNAVYVELLGNGLFGSVNYERQITKEPKLYARIGLGFWSDFGILGSSNSGYTIPISMNYLVDLKNNNFLDLGIGATMVKSDFSSQPAPNHVFILFTNVGFMRNFGNNFFWRFHITPYFDSITEDVTIEGRKQWFGFTIGKRF